MSPDPSENIGSTARIDAPMSDGGRVQSTLLHLLKRLTNVRHDIVFPFMKLPPEIRNIIYRLTLMVGFVQVADIFPWDYEKLIKRDKPVRRTSYVLEGKFVVSGIWQEKCTYYLNEICSPCRSISNYGCNMLALNKSTRSEAAPIFYGKNTFIFETTSSLIPFLRDRPQSVSLILSIAVCLYFEDYFSSYDRQASWSENFAKIQKIQGLNLQNFYLCLGPGGWKPHFGYKVQNHHSWKEELACAFTGLDALGLRLLGSWWSRSELVSVLKRDLWDFLAPRMLQKKGDVHDGNSLQTRRLAVDEDWASLETYIQARRHF